MAAHGAQKLFGWWNGPGLHGVHGWLTSMRFRGGRAPVPLLVAGEFGGGLPLASGLLVPLRPVPLLAANLLAIPPAHLRNRLLQGRRGRGFQSLGAGRG